jgi:quercetin dioxygenase-like cupin family protein
VREYKDDPRLYRDVARQVLLGGPGQPDLNFETRYFEIEPGGYTTLETHGHPHAVVVMRGKGTVLLGAEAEEIQAHDCVYIPGNLPHQFRADRGTALGFLCMVDRERDAPRPV